MSKHDCPESDCGLSFNFRAEVLAHLDWDHNRDEREAERLLTDD